MEEEITGTYTGSGTDTEATEVTEENPDFEQGVQENYDLSGEAEADHDQEVQETTESPNDYMIIESQQLELTNHMMAGQIFFMGLIFGVLLFKIFWDRWKV